MIYYYVPGKRTTIGLFFVSAKNRDEADKIAEKARDGFYELQYGGSLDTLAKKIKDKGLYDALGEMGY